MANTGPFSGLMLCASVDEEQEGALAEVKSQIKQILRKLSRNSEPQASIESGSYNLQSAPPPQLSFSTDQFGSHTHTNQTATSSTTT